MSDHYFYSLSLLTKNTPGQDLVETGEPLFPAYTGGHRPQVVNGSQEDSQL